MNQIPTSATNYGEAWRGSTVFAWLPRWNETFRAAVYSYAVEREMNRLRLFIISIGALAAVSASPVQASVIDTPTCKRALASLPISTAKHPAVAACSVHQQSLLETVRTRAVIAACKNGQEREQDVARLDGAIETINVAVADTCRDS